MWDDKNAYDRILGRQVERAEVTSVFLSGEKIWGTPKTGKWRHFAVKPPKAIIYKHPLLSADQRIAELKEDFRTLAHGLGDYRRHIVEVALTLLRGEVLYRSSKYIGPAEFLLDLHNRIAEDPTHKRNLIWRAVAKAPAGFAKPRSSMIGTLLDDIAAGLEMDAIKARFADKADPAKNMRPVAPPSAGNIAQAETIVAKMNLSPALERRFARLEELRLTWRPSVPTASQATGGTVFGHLKPAKPKFPSAGMIASPQNITWRKFKETVLPTARQIQMKLSGSKVALCAITAAARADAPPILQWDNEDGPRNAFAWYLYTGGSSPESWGLSSHVWINVAGVTPKPCLWDDPEKFARHGRGVVLVLEGARDSREGGLCIFPEFLRSELHSVRSTIESFSQKGKLQGRNLATACGVMISEQGCAETIRVTTDIGVADYRVDRWD